VLLRSESALLPESEVFAAGMIALPLDQNDAAGRSDAAKCRLERQQEQRNQPNRKEKQTMEDEKINRCVFAASAALTLACVIATAIHVNADDRDRDNRREREHESHDYIIERQQAYQVEGVPTSRIIDGRREIDVYPNGQMFEGNNLVGVRPPR